MFTRRYLKGNKGTEGPTSFLFFDTESHKVKHSETGLETDLYLRLWTACYVRREGLTFRDPIWHQGTTAEEFWTMVESYSDWRRPLWAFAHNAGHDLTQLDFWTHLQSRRWTAGPIDRGVNPETGKKRHPWRGRLCAEARPFFLVVRGRKGLLKVVDTINYWQTKLEAVGERLGVKKLKVDFDKCTDDELFTYCQRDADICRVAVCDLVRWWLTEDCGTFQVTGPMLAMNEWRHRTECRAPDGEKTSLVLEENSPARKAEREACLGGRVEPFYLGVYKGPVYHLDCNSLYPFVMGRGLFPRARMSSPGAMNLSDLDAQTNAFGAVACVLLDTGRSGETYPLSCNGVQVHATGNFATWLCGDELLRAIRLRHVTEVFDAHLYSLAPLFADWAVRWLTRRAEARGAGDVGREELCQLLLHSLAGKFAQRGDVWVDAEGGPVRRGWGQTVDVDHATGVYSRWRWLGGHTQRKQKGHEPRNAFPAVYAFVCAAAREYMKHAFALLPERSLLYTATDSIICTRAGFRALDRAGLLHPTEPGKFKLKGRAREAEICGPNWWRLGGEWVIGGLYGKAKLDPNGNYWCEVWERLGTLLNKNPEGRCGYKLSQLDPVRHTLKNDALEDGWRRPYRYTPVDGFCDPAPRRTAVGFTEDWWS